MVYKVSLNTKFNSIYFDNKDLDLSTLAKNPIQTTVSSNTVKVAAYLHGLYDTTSNTQLSGITGDRIGSVLSTSGANITDNTSLSDGTYPIAATSVSPVGGSGAIFSVTIASGALGSSISKLALNLDIISRVIPAALFS